MYSQIIGTFLHKFVECLWIYISVERLQLLYVLIFSISSLCINKENVAGINVTSTVPRKFYFNLKKLHSSLLSEKFR